MSTPRTPEQVADDAHLAHLTGRYCDRCDGCGRIAVDLDGAPVEDGTPWSVWENLPLKSTHAVLLGLIRPAPCPDCGGTGRRPPSPG